MELQERLVGNVEVPVLLKRGWWAMSNEQKLTADEIMNRVNAWQAHPMTTKLVCREDNTLLVFREIKDAATGLATHKLCCINCGYRQNVPDYVMRSSPKQLMMQMAFMKKIFEDPEILKEIQRRLEEDEIVD